MGIFGITTLVFVVLKLVNVIDWSWWLVCAPLFVGMAVYAAVATVALAFTIWIENQ